MSSAATTYGLVLALTVAGRPEEAALALDSIWSGDSERIEYVIASAEIDLARGDMGRAVTTLERRLELLGDLEHPFVAQERARPSPWPSAPRARPASSCPATA